MKILKLFTLSAVALLLCNCGSDPVPGPTPEKQKPVEEAAYVKLGSGLSAAISTGYDRTDIPVSFSTNKSWTAEVSFGAGASGWVTLSNRNGTSGSQTLIASVSENNDSAQRSAVITIKAETASVTVTISQEAFKSEFSISPEAIEVAAEGGTVEVSVTSNIGYHASTSVDWIHEMSTKATETKSLWFTVDANETSEPRSAVIVICNDNEVCIPVTVNQAGIPASISVSPSLLNFTSQGGSESIEINSNTDWTVSQKPEWCTVSLTSGSGDTTADVSVTENGNASPREGKIVFSTGEATAEVTVKQQSGQSGEEIVLELSVYTLQLDYRERCYEVKVTSNDSWSAVSSASWCTPEKIASGNYLNVCVKANDTGKKRTAQITIKTDSGGVERTLTVLQSALEENEGFGDDGQIKWD